MINDMLPHIHKEGEFFMLEHETHAQPPMYGQNGNPPNDQNADNQNEHTPNVASTDEIRMRWFLLRFVPLLFAASIVGSSIICCIMKSMWPLVIVEVSALPFYQIVSHFFPTDQRGLLALLPLLRLPPKL